MDMIPFKSPCGLPASLGIGIEMRNLQPPKVYPFQSFYAKAEGDEYRVRVGFDDANQEYLVRISEKSFKEAVANLTEEDGAVFEDIPQGEADYERIFQLFLGEEYPGFAVLRRLK